MAKDAEIFLNFFRKNVQSERVGECLCLLCVRGGERCPLKAQCEAGSHFRRKEPTMLDAFSEAMEIAQAAQCF